MFAHRQRDVEATFVSIRTTDGHEVRLTGDHYLYANGALATAKSVAAGDIVRAHDGTEVRFVRKSLFLI